MASDGQEDSGHIAPRQKDALDRWAEQAGQGPGGDKPDGDDQPDADKPRKKSLFSKWWVRLIIIVVVLALIAGGVIWWLIARQYEDTDDAFIDTHIVQV